MTRSSPGLRLELLAQPLVLREQQRALRLDDRHRGAVREHGEQVQLALLEGAEQVVVEAVDVDEARPTATGS